MQQYDAIIIGAGPAGLALGSELSHNHKILVIEQNKAGQTNKVWTTEKKIVKKSGLERFVSVNFKKCYLRSFKDNKFFIHGEFVSLDETELLKHFITSIVFNGSEIKDKCKFISIKNKSQDGITIQTGKGAFSCKLLIDCTGVDSKLAKKYGIYKRLFYFSVYGGVYSIKLKNEEIIFVDVIIKKFPISYIEVFPLSKTKCVFYTFQYLPYKKDSFKLKRTHEFHINNCYLKKKLRHKKRVREVYGVIPMGLMKKHAVDNVFFFGDACLLAGAIVGSGFTNILQHYKRYAQHISQKLKDSTLSKLDLDYQYSEAEMRNRNIQVILGTILLKAKPEQFDLIIDILKKLPNKFTLNLIFLRLNIKQTILIAKMLVQGFTLEGLAKLLPKEEYLFIAAEAAKIMEEITIEEAEKIFHKHHKAI